MTGALRQVFALSEAYPDLKANQNFLALQEELTATEGRVAYARQFYNDSVLNYNNKLQAFPTVIFANMHEVHQARVLRGRRGRPRGAQDRVLTAPVASARTPPRCQLSRRCAVTLSVVMFDLIRANKRRSVALVAGFVVLLVLVGAAVGVLVGYGLAGTIIALVISGGVAFASYWKADAIALGRQPRQARRPAAVPAAAQPRRGAVHRQRAAQAAGLHRRRPGAERVRHRSQPAPRGDRRHHRPAREDEPRRARRRARPRAVAHPQLRHPRVDAGGHARRQRSRSSPTWPSG